jgi:hypothetical protein
MITGVSGIDFEEVCKLMGVPIDIMLRMEKIARHIGYDGTYKVTWENQDIEPHPLDDLLFEKETIANRYVTFERKIEILYSTESVRLGKISQASNKIEGPYNETRKIPGFSVRADMVFYIMEVFTDLEDSTYKSSHTLYYYEGLSV